MVRTVALAALLFLAGCFGPAATSDDDAAAQGLDMSYFEACPAVDGRTLPCEGNATNPFYVEVADSWPAHWTCLTFADQRFAGGGYHYPFPDWYTLYGPAIADGAGGVEFQMGFAYDTHNDTDRVGGVIKLMTEDREELFTFEGPTRGFVRIPVEIQGPKLSYIGVLFPATPGTLSEEYAFPEDHFDPNVTAPMNFLNVTGLDVKRADTLWSLGEYRGPLAPSPASQFDLVRNVDSVGKRYHFPAVSEPPSAILDHTDYQGAANWGMGRGTPYETTVRHGPVAIDGTLQPYMHFGAKFEDVRNPVYTATVHWQCGCYGLPLTTVEGLFCAVGVPPPIVQVKPGGLEARYPGARAI